MCLHSLKSLPGGFLSLVFLHIIFGFLSLSLFLYFVAVCLALNVYLSSALRHSIMAITNNHTGRQTLSLLNLVLLLCIWQRGFASLLCSLVVFSKTATRHFVEHMVEFNLRSSTFCFVFICKAILCNSLVHCHAFAHAAPGRN